MLCRVTTEPINSQEALEYVKHPSCGAVALFEGIIREDNDGERVLDFYYEAYAALFPKVMDTLLQEARARWPIHQMAVIQRVGKLEIGDTGIVIATSSAHRREALDAVSYLIEQVKTRAPIWKKETTECGTKWANWPESLVTSDSET